MLEELELVSHLVDVIVEVPLVFYLKGRIVWLSVLNSRLIRLADE